MQLEERLTALEIHLMHQEATIQELNDVVIRQEQELDRISRDLELLKGQMRSLLPSITRTTDEEQPPPHY